MLSDILKALELLVKGLKGVKSPERKRRKIAQQLKDIYLDIDEIVERGNKIISSLESIHIDTTVCKVALSLLMDQQESLRKANEDFRSEDITQLLKIHLPDFRELELLYERKWRQIGLFISQLITDREASWKEGAVFLSKIIDTEAEKLLKLLEDYVNREKGILSYRRDCLLSVLWVDEEVRSKTMHPPLTPRTFRDDIISLLGAGEGIRIGVLQHIYVETEEVIVFAEQEQIRAAKEVLARIAELKEEVRLLLVEKFKIEDIL